MKSKTLVLLPGLMCDEAAWQAQIDCFQSERPVEVVDYGLLDSLPEMAAHVLASAPREFALAGHSMGGRIALEVIRMAPERVTHLGLFDTGCHAIHDGPASDRERAFRLGLLKIAREQGVCAMAKDWLKGMIHQSRHDDAALVTAIIEMFDRKSAETFGAQIHALLNRPEAYPVLAEIRCPTLLLAGSDDALSSPAANEEMALAIRSAIQVTIENCGHMAPQEKPDEVNAHMSEWLNAG